MEPLRATSTSDTGVHGPIHSNIELRRLPSYKADSNGHNAATAATYYREYVTDMSRGSTRSRVTDDGNTELAKTSGRLSSHISTSYTPLTKDDDADSKAPLDPGYHIYWKGMPDYLLSGEILSYILSTLFFALGCCVLGLRGKEESSSSRRIIQATQIAPSFWPIVYSGIIGKAIRCLADWRVERGVTLIDLEQLMGSLTMAGSVITIFRWSLYRMTSVALILLWAFNPVGSQASFRVAFLRNRQASRVGLITFVKPDLQKQLRMTILTTGSSPDLQRVQAIHAALLYDINSRTQNINKTDDHYINLVRKLGGKAAAGVQAAVDVWGNIRIPNIEYLDNYDHKYPEHWVETPWTQTIQGYASLLGNNHEGIELGVPGKASFNTQSSYQKFNCSSWFSVSDKDLPAWCQKALNKTLARVFEPSDGILQYSKYSFLSATPVNGSCDAPNYHPSLFWGVVNNATKQWTITRCSLSTTYVEAHVECNTDSSLSKSNCGVGRVRKIRESPTPEGASLLDGCLYFPNGTRISVGWQHISFVHDAFNNILTIGLNARGRISIVEKYLYNPLTAFDVDAYGDFLEVDVKNVEKRLSLLYNTLWQASWMYPSAMSGDLRALVTRGYAAKGDPKDYFKNTTSQIIYPLPPVYAISIPWMAVYFLFVGIMFSASVFSLIMHSQCRAPRLLGYTSSLIRDSVYFADSAYKVNSTEDGPKKSKRLASVKVMVMDTKGDEAAGKIAFAPAEESRQVSLRRWYE